MPACGNARAAGFGAKFLTPTCLVSGTAGREQAQAGGVGQLGQESSSGPKGRSRPPWRHVQHCKTQERCTRGVRVVRVTGSAGHRRGPGALHPAAFPRACVQGVGGSLQAGGETAAALSSRLPSPAKMGEAFWELLPLITFPIWS